MRSRERPLGFLATVANSSSLLCVRRHATRTGRRVCTLLVYSQVTETAVGDLSKTRLCGRRSSSFSQLESIVVDKRSMGQAPVFTCCRK